MQTYSDLKRAVINFSGRNDISVILDDAIVMTESEMYANSTQSLRLRSMETRALSTLPTSSRFLDLPSGFLMMRRLKIIGDGLDRDIKYRTPDQLSVSVSPGIPRHFTVGSKLEFDSVPDAARDIEMQYFKRHDPISESNPTNDVLTGHPQIYLYGCLWVVNQFAAEEDKADYYYSKMIEAIRGANKSDRRGRYGSAPVQRVEGVTP